jgi:transcriptional regulator with XRE-family HTH domain
MSKLKRRIKSSLAKDGFTMTDLAVRMNVTQGMLSNYLRGQSMKMSTALKIADALADMTGYHLTLNDFRKDEQ